PRINEPILGGSGIITGNFTVESANQLAVLIRAGALPAPPNILDQRTVSTDLGKDSIDAGKLASVIGFVAVVVFMVLSYGWFGVVANIALLFNLLLLLGGMSLIQATLTLPGIAGIVLTLGMAVDANVLVFERMREEIRAGKTAIQAATDGYKKVMTTILDANVTTLIAAAVMFEFGTGPVKGFAVTRTLGVITSMLTAVYVTRLIIASWIRRARPARLPI